METTITVKPNDVWRGRLILDGPGQYVDASFVANTLKANGAAQVWVWKSPDAASFPTDWPLEKRADVSDLFEVQWFVQLRVGGDPLTSTVQTFPTNGPNWRIHDAWLHQEGTAPPPTPEPPDPDPPPGPDPTKPPVPYEEDIGDYAGKPDKDLDKWAAGVLRAAWFTVFARWPTFTELQTVQAVGRHEGYYGWASKPPQWAGHHNWGAITCAKARVEPVLDFWGEPEPEATSYAECGCGFPSGDGYYVNGRWQPYGTCFATRPTNLEGAIHLVEVLVLKRPQVAKALTEHPGELVPFARAMRDTTYFCRTAGVDKRGKPCCACATDEQKQADAEWYASALDKACSVIGAKTGHGQVCFRTLPGQPRPPKPPPAPSATPTSAGYVASALLSASSTLLGVILTRVKRA